MGKTIYVADDEYFIRDVCLAMLKQDSGFDATAFDGGQPLIEAYKSRRPDLVITDSIMPGKRGRTS